MWPKVKYEQFVVANLCTHPQSCSILLIYCSYIPWLIMAAAIVVPPGAQDAQRTVSELFAFIERQGNSDYLGEAVSQLEHSLQAAQLAVDAKADDETILGALLHDVGRFIPAAEKMPAMVDAKGTFVGRGSHEVLGQQYLKHLGFSDKVCQLVGAHVMAKRYLATDKAYYDSLSPSSKTTLKYQVSFLLVHKHCRADRCATGWHF